METAIPRETDTTVYLYMNLCALASMLTAQHITYIYIYKDITNILGVIYRQRENLRD